MLVLGIGNEIAGDDAIGILAVKEVEKLGLFDVDFNYISTGGLQLLEALLGYDKVLIVDSVETETATREIRLLRPDDFFDKSFLASPHDVNFPTALKIGKKATPELMPKEIRIIAIEIPIQYEISDKISDETLKKLPLLKEKIIDELKDLLKKK